MRTLTAVRNLVRRSRRHPARPTPDEATTPVVEPVGGGAVTPATAPPPLDLRCRAPWASLYMDPRGEVKVCCQNEWLRLGNVAETPLVDIWRGDALTRLRERVAADDLSLGCEMCQVAVERGAADAAYFNSFAHLPVDLDAVDWPLQLELALSNTCNLQCVMCNGELSSAIRTRREGRAPLRSPYDDRFFDELDDFLPHLQAITFLGGEPFLARESIRVFDRLVERGLRPYCSVTTNGTQWNERIERYIDQLPMDIAISIDGVTAETLEAVRVGVDHSQLVRNVEQFREAIRRADGRMRFSYCLMMPTWREFGQLLEWADALDIDVFVNAVHHPPHLSFAHCPLDELEQVVSELRDEGRWREPQLGRNRSVWTEQVASLEGMYRQRSGETAEPLLAPDAVSTPVVLTRRSVADLGISVIRADEQQLITGVEPGAAAQYGVDLESLVGRSLWETVRLITTSLGTLESSDVRRTDDGDEERHLVFSGDEGRTSVRAAMNLGAEANPTWTLQFDRPGAVDPGSAT